MLRRCWQDVIPIEFYYPSCSRNNGPIGPFFLPYKWISDGSYEWKIKEGAALNIAPGQLITEVVSYCKYG